MSEEFTKEQALVNLCCYVVELWKAEQAYDRAQWKVSYYRKLKAKLKNSKKTNTKWNSDKLAKKIEEVRLIALEEQERLLDTKQRTSWVIIELKKILSASFLRKNGYGRVLGIYLPLYGPNKVSTTLSEDRITAIVDEYEANKVLTTALEDNEPL